MPLPNFINCLLYNLGVLHLVKPIFPIVDAPALLVNFSNKKIMCIADLHLGYEFLLAQKGVVIPSQVDETKARILDLVELTNPDDLIILGDVKHNIFNVPSSEWRGVTKLLEEISGKTRVQIVLGNHDANLNLLLPKNILVHSSKGFLIVDDDVKVGLIHGHAWPKPDLLQADYIITGHNHPVIEMRDELGGKWFEPVWLEVQLSREKIVAPFAGDLGSRGASFSSEDSKSALVQIGNPKIIVMPAFNPLLGGVALNRPEINFLGPILSSNFVEKGTAKVKLLDGTFLGSLENCSRLVKQDK